MDESGQINEATQFADDTIISMTSSVTGNNVPPSIALSSELEVIHSQESSNKMTKKRPFPMVVEPSNVDDSTSVKAGMKEALECGLILHGLLQRSHANFGIGNVGLAMLQANSSVSTKFTTANSLLAMSDDQAIEAACQKYFSDCPPFVHFSAKDSAPISQLSISPQYDRLSVYGGMRGYRMARASHGVDAGTYYYEVMILDDSTQFDATPACITSSNMSTKDFQLPPLENLRTGPKLSQELKLRDDSNGVQQPIGTGHVRIGWSMRTGDLQAPVGYDKWSYGLCDIKGSKIHDSKRHDKWGGSPFGPGDVIGLAIHLNAEQIGGINLGDGFIPDQSSTEEEVPVKTKTKKTTAKRAEFANHIRFFKNGIALGPGFVSLRGTRTGCEAFTDIESGMYCPAVSSYMGARLRANFGPHFIYPVSSTQLPTGMTLRPMSDRCAPPMSVSEALEKCMSDKALSMSSKNKASSAQNEKVAMSVFTKLIRLEVAARNKIYSSFQEKHKEEIRQLRIERNICNAEDLR